MDNLAHAMCSYFFCKTFLEQLVFCPDRASLFLGQLLQRDERGNLPLHYAVQCRFVKDWDDQEKLHVQEAKLYWADIVAILVKTGPEAALAMDGHGQLPLFTALRATGLSWNHAMIMKLVKECPRVLHQREESSMLFPALFAATRASESDEHLSVAYELLKETPELMLHAL
jgi:hypothetical protein